MQRPLQLFARLDESKLLCILHPPEGGALERTDFIAERLCAGAACFGEADIAAAVVGARHLAHRVSLSLQTAEIGRAHSELQSPS